MSFSKNLNNKIIFTIIVFSIITAGTILRINNYDKIPMQGETYDEYMWTLLGKSVLEFKKPSAWSYFEYKQNTQLNINGAILPGVIPFVDHPPLFAFIPGITQIIYNFWNIGLASVSILRIPMLLLGVVNFFLLYLLCKHFFTKKWLIVATSIYAIFPTLVISSRLVPSENLLTTFTLLIFLLFFRKENTKLQKILLFVLFLALPLIKITGTAIALIFLIIFFRNKELFKTALYGLIAGTIISFIYYFAIDFNQYLFVYFQQTTNRNTGFASFLLFFIQNKITTKYFYDGFFLFGMFGYFWLLFQKHKEEKINKIIVFTTLFMLFLVFSSGETTSIYKGTFTGPSIYGWYKIPVLPFIVVFATLALQNIYRNYNKLAYILFLVLSTFVIRIIFFSQFLQKIEMGIGNNIVRGVYLLIFASFLLSNKYWKKYFTISLTIVFIVGFIANLLLTNSFLQLDATYILGI
ncbi:glycosyltransferase family 39 protein [Patescibacteria group bacterium]|nr:glycosyltransferase family 39 protein [Patescibacteria group bacterium]